MASIPGMTKASDLSKHVAVFAFPFGSHRFTLLNLIVKLAHAAPQVTFSFITTAESNQALFSKPNIPENIKPYNVANGIPRGLVVGKHPFELVNFFLQAGAENLKMGIDLAVKSTNQRVSCILADAFLTDSLSVARQLHVPWVAAWLVLSTSLSPHFHTDLVRLRCANSNGNKAVDFLPGLSQMVIEDLPDDIFKVGEEETLFARRLASMGKVLPEAKAVVMNFYEELDPPLFVKDMKSKLQSMLYAGLLTLSLPSPPLPPSDTDTTGCLSWLDKQSSRTVAYISFGTVVAPTPREFVALAEALEASAIPFLWSLNEELKGLLPNGFVERTGKQGKIVPWAPQTQVLAHDSVGVYVSHSGTNSVMESLSNGVPVICRPFFADHGMTVRMVEDIWGVGVRTEGGVFSKNGLLESLKLILVQEEGKKMKENALKFKRTLLDAAGPQGKAVQDFKTLVELISNS